MSSAKWRQFCLGLNMSMCRLLYRQEGRGWGLSKVVVTVTFNHVGGPFNLFKYRHLGCLNNPIFGVMCCMFRTFGVSSRITANINEPSLLLSQ